MLPKLKKVFEGKSITYLDPKTNRTVDVKLDSDNRVLLTHLFNSGKYGAYFDTQAAKPNTVSAKSVNPVRVTDDYIKSLKGLTRLALSAKLATDKTQATVAAALKAKDDLDSIFQFIKKTK